MFIYEQKYILLITVKCLAKADTDGEESPAAGTVTNKRLRLGEFQQIYKNHL